VLVLVAFAFFFANIVCAQAGAQAAPTGPSAATPPMIILIGPPLSGKSTFAEQITKNYGIPGIAVEDLIKENAAELTRLHPEGLALAEMRTDPAISRYMRGKFQTMDLSHGVALDGYPATLAQSEELAKMVRELQMYPLVFQLKLPDDVIRARAKQAGQTSDSPKIVEQRIKDYHREMDGIGYYFPNAKLVAVDVNKPEVESWKAMQAAMDQAGIKAAK
jgi:adenylate kinase family enzyme